MNYKSWLLLILLSLAPSAQSEDSSFWPRYEQLRAGATFSHQAPTGQIVANHSPGEAGGTYHYLLDVPKDYTPEVSWPVHIYLHGGIENSANKIGKRTVESLEKLRQEGVIAVYPSAWRHHAWWHKGQHENIPAILDTLKQQYNVDENRVFVLGYSDGGSGAFYIASRYPTAFAGFVSLNGSVRVLHAGNDVYGTSFYNNFIGKPIFAVNATRDPLYPAKEQAPIMEQIEELGGPITWLKVKGKHDLRWYGEIDEEVKHFLSETRRNPFPEYVRWQVDKGGEFTRNHWLVAGELLDPEQVGLVDALRRGNEVFVSSVNLQSASILLSPEVFDFEAPIKIWANKELVFDDLLQPSVATLEKWYARDKDRSMLIGREVKLVLAASEMAPSE